MKQKAKSEKRSARLLWRGATTVTAGVLAFALSVSPVINVFRTDIDKFLGTQSVKIVTGDVVDEDVYSYKSDYSSTAELLGAVEDIGKRMSEEGSVLLKNNGALPLSEDEIKKVSLLGFSSYFPVQGGDMGSSVAENVGTDADTVDLVQAFTSKGYEFNPTVSAIYSSLKDTFKVEVESWGGALTFYRATAPTTDGFFTSRETAVDVLDRTEPSWKASMDDYNIMIVTIARAAGENRNYMPGLEGVDPDQKLNQTDPLGLSDTERNIINAAVTAKQANGGKVIVLLNNSSSMEIDEIKNNDGIDAILEIGLPGAHGFYGVADILKGEVNPSGHLTDTYSVVNANLPAAQNYGNLQYTNANQESYINSVLVEAEGIYTGYKYFETRYADVVLGQGNASDSTGSSTSGAWAYENEVSYPFGYGLSYTNFVQDLENLEVNLNEGTVTATVKVTNNGDMAGKDVVQLYVSLPYTEYNKENLIEKAAIQLLDYEKTGIIEPGASETVTITADAQYMASWDSSIDNAIGTKGTYILDGGDYHFTVGNGSHEAVNNVLAAQGKTVADGMTQDGNDDNVKTWNLSEFDSKTFAHTKSGEAVENQLEDMDLNYYMPGTVTYLSRNNWKETWPKTYDNLTATEEMLEILDNDTYEIQAQGDPSNVVFGENNGLTLADLKGVEDLDDPRWELLMNQITLEEAMIRTGFGGSTTKPIDSIVSPEVVQNDGPNGLNSYTLGQYANTDTASDDPYAIDAKDKNLTYKFGTMPSSTVIAQTFSKELAKAYGEVLGNYSIWANLTIHWSAGTNLHRVPYNARNHEYYSEDPILSAYQGAALISGGNNYGIIIAPKHFAFNDTEVNRSGVSVFMTEQKARETELRGTQACIEDAKALGVMTTFNRIGVHAGNAHYGLLKNILREEWGFKGLMSQDFITDPGFSVLKESVNSGVTMTTNTGDNTMKAVTEKWSYWNVDNVSKDEVMLQSLKNAMTWQNYALANSNAMDGLSSSSYIVNVKTWYDNMITAMQAIFAILTLGALMMYFKNSKKSMNGGM